MGGNDLLMKHDVGTHWENVFLTPSEDALCTMVDGEAVLLNLANGFYYSLNAVGATIWDQLSEGKSLQQILHIVCDQFSVTEDVARKDLAALVTELGQEGLIQEERR